jgi:flagellar protein FliS
MALTNHLYNQFQRNKLNIQQQHGESEVVNTAASQPVNKNAAYQQYQSNVVNTASPQELTLMLYNGLIKFLNLSIQGIEERSIEKANHNILRCQDIIREFMSTLDRTYEVSEGMLLLYDYMNRRLIEANMKKDREIVAEVLGFTEELRDTWAQAMKLAKQQAANK